jgi:hypothetical protein
MSQRFWLRQGFWWGRPSHHSKNKHFLLSPKPQCFGGNSGTTNKNMRAQRAMNKNMAVWRGTSFKNSVLRSYLAISPETFCKVVDHVNGFCNLARHIHQNMHFVLSPNPQGFGGSSRTADKNVCPQVAMHKNMAVWRGTSFKNNVVRSSLTVSLEPFCTLLVTSAIWWCRPRHLSEHAPSVSQAAVLQRKRTDRK